MGGAAVFSLWMIWLSVDGLELESALRWFGAAIGIGFTLLFISVVSIGTWDPSTTERPGGLMEAFQLVGGGLAYIGFPIWLLFFARQFN